MSMLTVQVLFDGFSERLLTVDEPGCVEVISAEGIDWRKMSRSRCWLVAMESALQVAVLVPGERIAEAKGYGI
jgi:hypothetical protein